MNLGQLKGALEALGVWSKKRLEGWFYRLPKVGDNGVSNPSRWFIAEYQITTNNFKYRFLSETPIGSTIVARDGLGRTSVAVADDGTHATPLSQVQTLINDRLSSVDALDPTTATLEDLINAIQNVALVPLEAAKTLELADDDYLESGETI